MKKMTSSEIRNMFLQYFAKHGHMIEPSSPLVPKDDPTLLWINSGVATMKKYFDGTVVPKSPRIVSSQKSLRANDIENVGVTARHHTLFEMLGNFSIGDYFKKEAVEFAWDFLTNPDWMGLDPDKIYVTVYYDDEETYALWTDNIGLDPSRITKNNDDNYWEIGEGPCGPCTEIFYDRGPAFNYNTPESELFVGGENDRYVEIWNVVFSQFNAQPGVPRSEYKELPSKNIDTGLGLERLVSIIQDGETNFETDLFLPIIAKIELMSGVAYKTATKEQAVAFKLIADHTRALVFAIADGALPSNEGRGYVIRRLLRRAVRHARVLGLYKAFMYELTDSVVEVMGDYYGYLLEKVSFIKKIIKTEEEKFLSTLNDGEKKLEEILQTAESKVISGKDAFTLYDTYGFPIELTEEMVEEKGYSVDRDDFTTYMNEQKDRARNARHTEESMHVQATVLKNFTETSHFVGYDSLEAEGKVLLLLSEDNKSVKALNRGERGTVILSETPFYAESGGQVADTGTLMNDRSIIRVDDVKKAPNGQALHSVHVIEGVLEIGKQYIGKVDARDRLATERNHTATHLLQYALRKILGNHIEQAGSLVNKKHLRFDFSHFEALTHEQIIDVERKVNEMIWKAKPVTIQEMPIEDAKKLGAMALFGEKYGNTVRVVQTQKSIELCGGTHVSNTANIGIFKIVSETGIGSGVRRIEAITSEAVYEHLHNMENVAYSIRDMLKKRAITDINDAVATMLEQNKQLQTEVKLAQKSNMTGAIEQAMNNPLLLNEVPIIFQTFDDYTVGELKQMVDLIKERTQSYLAFLVSNEDDKTNFVVASSKDIQDEFKSNDVIKSLNELIESRGGGKPDIAQASVAKKIGNGEIIALLQKIFVGGN